MSTEPAVDVATPEAPAEIGIRDLLDAGLHFGHQTKRWNPKMKRYIFDKRNGIHIIDLSQSLSHLEKARKFIYDLCSGGRRILFVGTKKQAQEVIKDVATRGQQHYVVSRWLGGTLTNNQTVRRSVRRMREIENLEKTGQMQTLPKKEVSRLNHEFEKLQKNLFGVANMDELPGAMFVVDVNREKIAVDEANRLHIPVVAIVDTNCDPDPIDYPIPGNDDAIRAIKVILDALSKTIEKANGEYARVAAEENRKRAEAQAQGLEPAKPVAAPSDERRRPARTGARRPRPEGAGTRTRRPRKDDARPAAEPKAAAPAPAPEAKPEA